ncbi:MAG TPA: SSI family serine proteinase inhibitor [Streptosporangiaceae bacterium]|nr:SSI family serine proteinase inhibitor [Streptosporangiaceae bacterium]
MMVRTFISRHSGAALCVLAAGAAATGCGSAAAPGTGTASPLPAKVAISFTISGAPGTAAEHGTLQCEPPGGSIADPATACNTLLALKQPFAPLPRRIVCPMIMASSRQITVTGTWFGEKVHRVVIDGGCDLTLFGTLDNALR